jgi:hypothetical protein
MLGENSEIKKGGMMQQQRISSNVDVRLPGAKAGKNRNA